MRLFTQAAFETPEPQLDAVGRFFREQEFFKE